eukprot:1780458-Alexandrium_andersonii.AAC.1
MIAATTGSALTQDPRVGPPPASPSLLHTLRYASREQSCVERTAFMALLLEARSLRQAQALTTSGDSQTCAASEECRSQVAGTVGFGCQDEDGGGWDWARKYRHWDGRRTAHTGSEKEGRRHGMMPRM